MAEQQKSSIYHIIAFAFQGQDTADQFVDKIKEGQKKGGYKLIAQGIAVKDEKGKVHFHEPGKGGVGTGVGLVAGGLLGLIGGPVGLLAWAVAGGVVGGVAGHFLGRAIDPDELKQLGDALELNSSAFLVMVEDTETEQVIDSMQGYNAQVITLTVGDQLSGEIDQAVSAQISVPPASAAGNSDDKHAE